MRKIFLALILCLVSIASNSQNFFNFQNNKTIGFGIGSLQCKSYDFNGLTFNASLFGFYLDVSIYSSLEKNLHSMSVNHHMDAGKLKTWHIGYKIPVTKWLYVYPLLGKSHLSTGYCDGSNYTISNGGTVHNHYYPTRIYFDNFDYGCGIDIQYLFANYIGINVGGTITKYVYNIKFELIYKI